MRKASYLSAMDPKSRKGKKSPVYRNSSVSLAGVVRVFYLGSFLVLCFFGLSLWEIFLLLFSSLATANDDFGN